MQLRVTLQRESAVKYTRYARETRDSRIAAENTSSYHISTQFYSQNTRFARKRVFRALLHRM